MAFTLFLEKTDRLTRRMCRKDTIMVTKKLAQTEAR
jgi:hypothetical protein